MLGRRIELGLDAVFDKLVRQRRGGYCFEQNGLFLHVLTALGFEARPLSARVRIDRPRDYTPARTHMFLRVEPDGRRITLLNRELKLRDRDGQAERRALDSPHALLAVLAEQFGLHFPKETRFGGGASPWPTKPRVAPRSGAQHRRGLGRRRPRRARSERRPSCLPRTG